MINYEMGRVEAGDYWSEDDRFHILKTWDRLRGNHWSIRDTKTGETHTADSLKHSKQIAESLV